MAEDYTVKKITDVAETTTADTLFIKSGGDIKQISMANLLTQMSPDIQLATLKKQMPIGYTFAWSQTSGSGIDLSTAEKVAEYYGFGTWEQVEKTYYSEFKQFSDTATIRNSGRVVINITDHSPEYEFICGLQPYTSGFVKNGYVNSPNSMTPTIWFESNVTGDVCLYSLWGKKETKKYWRRIA